MKNKTIRYRKAQTNILHQNNNTLSPGRFSDIVYCADHPFISMDLFRKCLGDKVHEGTFRAVYNFDPMPGYVIKIAGIGHCGKNLNEFALWETVKGTPMEKWFAPCKMVSAQGYFLIQKKTRPIIKGKQKLPRMIPALLSDTHTGNFGYIGRQLVSHDYHFLDNMLIAAQSAPMCKAVWR